jgi:hypothetical protein
MKDNPIVAAVRKTRKQISAKYGNDLKKLVAHYQQMERRFEGKIYTHKVMRKAV